MPSKTTVAPGGMDSTFKGRETILSRGALGSILFRRRNWARAPWKSCFFVRESSFWIWSRMARYFRAWPTTKARSSLFFL